MYLFWSAVYLFSVNHVCVEMISDLFRSSGSDILYTICGLLGAEPCGTRTGKGDWG